MARRNQRPLLLFFVTLTAGAGLSAQAPAPDLSDQEVAHVAVTANSIDIELAKFAESRTRKPEVRKFAATMIADHGAVHAQAAALAERLGVVPRDNAVSQSLLTGAGAARAAIQKLEGIAFDRAYMDREIA